MFQYSPILGRSSIWDLKYTFFPNRCNSYPPLHNPIYHNQEDKTKPVFSLNHSGSFFFWLLPFIKYCALTILIRPESSISSIIVVFRNLPLSFIGFLCVSSPSPSSSCFHHRVHQHRRTGRCGILAIATWAAWFWAAQGRLLTKKKEERKGRKGRFNIFATAGLRTQSAIVHQPHHVVFHITTKMKLEISNPIDNWKYVLLLKVYFKLFISQCWQTKNTISKNIRTCWTTDICIKRLHIL